MIVPDFRLTKVLVETLPGHPSLCAPTCRFKIEDPWRCTLFQEFLEGAHDPRDGATRSMQTIAARCRQCLDSDEPVP